MQISVSITKVKSSRIDAIKQLNQTDCDYIHVDTMDGVFVANKQLMYDEFVDLIKDNNKSLDVHLMVEDPKEEILKFKGINPSIITIHVEINQDLNSLINLIHEFNIKAGLALNPDTKIEKIYPYLPIIDHVLVMSVTPGEGGQEFMMEAVDKVKIINQLRIDNNYNYTICVDGGINDKTSRYVKDTGADMVVSGSYICMKDEYQKQIDNMR